VRIFDEETLRRLEALRLAVRRGVRSRGEGDRPTGRRGGASDFVAHRGYLPGDDPRSIDWHVYARLGQLFVRERAREERLTLHLAFDASPSMGVGEPSKATVARRVAAGLSVAAFAESGRVVLWGPSGGRRCDLLGPLLGALDAPMATAPASETLRALRMGARERGALVFFSDLWDEDAKQGLLEASNAGEAAVLHVLAQDELYPRPMDQVRLVDAETREAVERFVGADEIAQYGTLLSEHCEKWKKWCHEHGIAYVRTSSGSDWTEVVTVTLREAGILE